MMTKFWEKVFLFLSALIIFGGNIPLVSAQESTNQRTTGTYLPSNTVNQRQEVMASKDSETKVTLPNGNVIVMVPAGSYINDLRVAIRELNWKKNNAVPSLKIANESFVGEKVFDITAVEYDTGQPVLQMTKPWNISFRYTDQAISGLDEKSIKVRFFDRLKQEWTEMPINKDLESNTLTIESDHLTIFAICAGNPVAITTTTTTVFGIWWWWRIAIVILIFGVLGVAGWYVYVVYYEDKTWSEEKSVNKDEEEFFGSPVNLWKDETNVVNQVVEKTGGMVGSENENIDESKEKQVDTKNEKNDDDQDTGDKSIWLNI